MAKRWKCGRTGHQAGFVSNRDPLTRGETSVEYVFFTPFSAILRTISLLVELGMRRKERSMRAKKDGGTSCRHGDRIPDRSGACNRHVGRRHLDW